VRVHLALGGPDGSNTLVGEEKGGLILP